MQHNPFRHHIALTQTSSHPNGANALVDPIPAVQLRRLATGIFSGFVGFWLLASMFTPTAEGASLYWTGAINGNWSEAGNWDPQTVPQNGDNVFFVRDNDAHRVMTNDLVNLSIDRMHFGVFFQDQGDNDYNYELNGNSLSFVSDGSLISSPDGSSTVTINCPLRFHDGGYIGVESESINPLFQETARLVINGPLTANAGVLRLTASGTYLFGNKDGRLILAGALSGNGDVRLEPYSFSSVEFIGPANNTLSGTMYLYPREGGEVIFDKTAGYVVTNVLSVVSGNEATLKLNEANQFGPNATILLTEDSILHLTGTSQLVGNLVFTNNLLPAGSPPILDTGTTTCTLRNGIISRVTENGGAPPLITGRLGLTAGNHDFNVESSVYAGLEIQAEILGAGGFTKTGGAALLLKGANTFIGNVTSAEGIVDVHTPGAFGGTAGGVTLSGGSVTLRNVSIQGEPLIASSGDGAGEFPGSALTVIGAATWTGPVTLYTNLNLIGGDMVISGPISGAGGLGCFSLGTITLGGTLGNTYTGTTLVRGPLLQFAKPSGVKAYDGPLIVGGGLGASCEARWLNSYQRLYANVTLFDNGILNLNNFFEDLGPITFNGGGITTGTGELGIYGLVTVNSEDSSATISGRIGLPSGVREFSIPYFAPARPDLVINAVISGSGQLVKTGFGWLALSGANTYSGLTLVNQGMLTIKNPLALGAGDTGTVVANGATLQLDSLNGGVVPERISVSGSGFSFGALEVLGNARLRNQFPSVYACVDMTANATICVFNPNTWLNVDGFISGNGPLEKTGLGSLVFSNANANTYSGDTIVRSGAVELSKPNNAIAIPGNLIIGPPFGVSPTVARWNQSGGMHANRTITVNANSLLDLNGYNQTLAQLNLNDGGNAQTATGILGFPAGGSVNIGTLNPGLPGLQNSSSISGRIALPPLDYLTFNVSGYGQQPLSFEPELAVSAAISGGGNIIKNGFGAMRLSGANTFNDSPPFAAGDLIINAGTVVAAGNGALGGTAGWTWVMGGGRLSLINNITVGGETLYLNSTNPIVLDNPGGNNTWTGPVILARDSGISVNQDWSLFLYGAISGSSANDLTKVGMGALIFGGTPANTYAGETFINAGELHLAKPFVVAAVPGALSIGNAAGAIATVRNYQSYQVIGNIFVNRNGTLDINGFEENVDHLYLADGGDVHTGTGYLYLKTAGSLTVTPGNNNNLSTISGNVEILPGTFPFNINAAPNSTNQPDLDVPARISSSGTITLQKNGAGRLRFGGNNTYVGQTYINGGTLWVDGLQPQSPVTLDHDTRLQGGGTVGHIILNGGSTTISLGTSPGTLTTSNVVASGGTGTLQIELNGTTPGSGHDQVNVRGTVNLTGLKLSGVLGFNAVVGDQFTIINNDGSDAVTGTFTGLPQNSTLAIGGKLFSVSYTGGSGNDVVLYLIATNSASTSNLLFNDGFELPVIGVTNQYRLGNALLGWTVTTSRNGVYHFKSSYAPVSEAQQAVQIETAGDTLSQPLTTTPGQVYHVSFDLSAYDAGGASLGVMVGGTVATFNGTNNAYTHHGFSFVAPSTTTTLTFSNAGVYNVSFPHLDNVVVVPLPPPVLTIEKITPSLVRLRWPTNDPAFRLIAGTNLTITNWTQVLPLPVTVGTNRVVTNAIFGPQRFYRLSNP